MKPLAISLLFFLTISFSAVFAQPYGWSLGGRIGTEAGLTVKHYLNRSVAIEGLGLMYHRGVRVGALLEQHFDLDRRGNTRLFAGAGLHAGYNGRRIETDQLTGSLGVDAIGGVAFIVPNLPIELSLDWKPAWEFAGQPGFSLQRAGVSLRVMLD
jgi:hypothetical protein